MGDRGHRNEGDFFASCLLDYANPTTSPLGPTLSPDPGTIMPMGKMRNKLRRNRKGAEGGEIVSRLPSAAQPASRVAAPSVANPLAGYLEVGEGSEALSLESVADRVLRGDSARVLERLPEGFAALAITSPPYWNLVDYGAEGQIGSGSYDLYRERLTEVWRGVSRSLRPNGKFCLNVPLMPVKKAVSREEFGKTHTRVLLDLYADLKADILAATDLRFYSLYIWEKQTTEKMFGSYPFPPNLYERNYVEFIAVFVKPGAPPKYPAEVKEGARLSQDEWMDLTQQIWWIYPENVRRKDGHPAPFPEALPNRLTHMFTFPAHEGSGFEGDVVLDPFNGWGTTCVAAKRAGRRFVGIDLSASFCAEAVSRLAETPVAPEVIRIQRPR